MMLKRITIPTVLFAVSTLATVGRSQEHVPSYIQDYIHECQRQLNEEIERIRNSDLAADQRQARVNVLLSQPFYARLHLDVPLEVGQMGVLPPEVTAQVYRIEGDFDVLLDLSWSDESFPTTCHRQVWLHGRPTRDLQEGLTIELPGVLKVIGKKAYKQKYDVEVSDPVVMSVSVCLGSQFKWNRLGWFCVSLLDVLFVGMRSW